MTSLNGNWKSLCSISQLLPGGGVAALVDGQQIALFYLPGQDTSLYAIDNLDPASGAAVLSRGIVGDLNGVPVVASPLYKQHYCLRTGECLEDDTLSVQAWPCMIKDEQVYIETMSSAERIAS
jgi:NAD(P)H-dependent nitrite reductase small subunit